MTECNINVQCRYEGDIIPQGLSITWFHGYSWLPADYVYIRHDDYILRIRIPKKDPKNYTIEEHNDRK